MEPEPPTDTHNGTVPKHSYVRIPGRKKNKAHKNKQKQNTPQVFTMDEFCFQTVLMIKKINLYNFSQPFLYGF